MSAEHDILPKKGSDTSLPFTMPTVEGKYRTGLHVLNSMSGSKTEFVPQKTGRTVTWYSCGPTTYDAAHMGHARNYVMSDVLRRLMEDYFGYNVHMCMNVTDVDDKIIIRSNEQKVNFRELAAKWELAFWEDMQAFNVKLPDVITRVSEHLPEIVTYIETIISNGYAYESNGSVYFDIQSFCKSPKHYYSRMDPSRSIDIEGILEGEGALGAASGESTEKRDLRDFALWKASKPEEPSWDSPWGKGRPGWHIECSAMASYVYDFPIDIHSGGVDLKFPHHTNELAQSEAYYDKPQWVNYFIHNGHLSIDGCKMSKSLKNFIVIKECLEDVPARQWRIMFALNRWCAPMNYDPSGTSVNEAIAIDKKFANFFGNIKAILRGSLRPEHDSLGKMQKWSDLEATLEKAIEIAENAVHEALCDNLNTIETLNALGTLVSAVNSYTANCDKSGRDVRALAVKKAASFVFRILRCMGIAQGTDEDLAYGEEQKSGVTSSADAVAPVMDILATYRQDVRKIAVKILRAKELGDAKEAAKEIFTLCDKIRDDDLAGIGITLEDGPNGSVWKT